MALFTHMNRTDKQFVIDCLKGDEKSLELLIQSYLKPIYSFTYRYVGNRQDAEDVTQETFVKMWRNLKKFDQQKSFKTWIFQIAKNTAFDHLKKSRSVFGGEKTIPFSEFFARGLPAQAGGSAFGGENEAGENTIIETLADPSPLPDELLERAGVAQMLTSAMEILSPKYRMVLFLRYNDHFNFREIAESLDEPLNTVKSRHRRALIMLKKLLSDS